MKIKNYTKFTMIILFLFSITIVFLLLFKNDSPIKVKNNGNICDLTSFYKENDFGSLSYCFDDTVKVSINNDKQVKLEIDDIKDVFYYYNLIDDTTYVYIINNKGNVYETNSNNLMNKNYKLEKLSINNIEKIKTLNNIDENTKFSIYAINKKNELILLKELY